MNKDFSIWKGRKTQYGVIADIIPASYHPGFGKIIIDKSKEHPIPTFVDGDKKYPIPGLYDQTSVPTYYIFLDDLRHLVICKECKKEYNAASYNETYCSFTCRSKEMSRKLEETLNDGTMKEYFDELQKKEDVLKKQLSRFHDIYGSQFNVEHSIVDRFIDKVVFKYNTKEYRDRWLNRGIEPQEALYDFLFEYAKEYGKVCRKKKYLNMFTGEAFYLGSYVIQVIHGQGSAILVTRIK